MAYQKKEKVAFLIYYDDFLNVSEALDNEDLGKWLKYIADYEINGVIPEIDDRTLAYIVKRNIQQLDRDKLKYAETVKTKTRTAYIRELRKWNIEGVRSDGEIDFDSGSDITRFVNHFGSKSAKDIDKDWLKWAMDNCWSVKERSSSDNNS